jgi:hypothetical protein
MKLAINYLLRALCLLVYALAAAKLAGWLPAGTVERTPLVAGALLAVHAAELVFKFRQVRLYPGPLAVSIVLTLLFGLLHWKPLADQAARQPDRG